MNMVKVNRLGLGVEFSVGAYEEFMRKSELEKDNYFKELISLGKKETEPVELEYSVEGIPFSNGVEALRYRAELDEVSKALDTNE